VNSDQSHVIELLREHGPLAPPALRARIEADSEGAERRRRRVSRALPRLAPVGAIAVFLAALAFALPALFGGEGVDATDAHALSAAGPTAPAPQVQRDDPELLAADVRGVPFPDWERKFGWHAFGQRSDNLDGRSTRTVFYTHEGHKIGYTIVSGSPLQVPGDPDVRRVNGVEVELIRDYHGHDIAVFERQGMTCVLSGHVIHRSTLVELATWQGDGRVRF
jgi:hypothetical protein